ncbi:conserved hypothetical protein [Denitrovibrio acetiphilus DSM 12809]|uniref:Uncharacterized protein n=1 Tax=Denitrovibrio acetiphilus (strain DSM 12809 / NBRC 114555 / N2460) TaxID=522772 RepID=D4H5Y3_DENA2|nr:hypothetical protein [Denitrovibrio acetiphilus]ADD69574.1 conserved hypothetical protein [Denitrovibrio acetiphilus DSM 12809]
MVNRYVIAAIISTVIVVLSYIYHFYYLLKYSLSNDTAAWAQFSDYVGGLLNPVLSFIALVLLIKSLTLQNEANKSLKEELRNNEQTEKLRMFETQFFNMLNSQSMALDSFKIEVKENGDNVIKKGVEAICHFAVQLEPVILTV